MKKFVYMSLILLILSMTACLKDETLVSSPMCIQDSEMVTFEVSVSEANTKAVTTIGEDRIKSVQIYVFDASEGYIETYVKATTVPVVVSSTTGEKEIVALVNAADIIDIADKAELLTRVTNLSENSTSAFVMFGSVVESIAVDQPNMSIIVSRLVARISIGKIVKKFPLPVYQDGATIIKRIFLENVVGDMTFREAESEYEDYIPTIWYNKGEFNSDLPDLLSDEINVVLRDEYTVPHYFYCYPNQNPEENATRLVVETSIDGKPRYYPITILGIKSNHSYHISELTITRLGSLYPDRTVEIVPVKFQIEVSDWEPGMEDIKVVI